jgi:hypothetical protein
MAPATSSRLSLLAVLLDEELGVLDRGLVVADALAVEDRVAQRLVGVLLAAEPAGVLLEPVRGLVVPGDAAVVHAQPADGLLGLLGLGEPPAEDLEHLDGDADRAPLLEADAGVVEDLVALLAIGVAVVLDEDQVPDLDDLGMLGVDQVAPRRGGALVLRT